MNVHAWRTQPRFWRQKFFVEVWHHPLGWVLTISLRWYAIRIYSRGMAL